MLDAQGDGLFPSHAVQQPNERDPITMIAEHQLSWCLPPADRLAAEELRRAHQSPYRAVIEGRSQVLLQALPELAFRDIDEITVTKRLRALGQSLALRGRPFEEFV